MTHVSRPGGAASYASSWTGMRVLGPCDTSPVVLWLGDLGLRVQPVPAGWLRGCLCCMPAWLPRRGES